MKFIAASTLLVAVAQAAYNPCPDPKFPVVNCCAYSRAPDTYIGCRLAGSPKSLEEYESTCNAITGWITYPKCCTNKTSGHCKDPVKA
ncbi:hypothetical protein PT974_03030 [Cladobotryum mycophilum]|uniref:Uncharacterized protein n=1 Tax=Cladobotryum mycophilum TaxID=491253 RepID=A0ABR0SX10_9HYPO